MANQYTVSRKQTDECIECRKCFLMKPYTEFHKDSTSKYGVTYYCKMCANASSRKNHARRMVEDLEYKDAKRASYIKSSHGITVEEYEAKLAAQGYTCAICGVKLSSRGHNTHLDHCHKSGKLRAMLCTNCNRGLGHFKDNPKFLLSAVEYLKEHSADEDCT